MVYLSGERAGEVADAGADGIRARVVGDRVGRVRREDVHRVGLQGHHRGVGAGAADGDAHGVLDVVIDDLGEASPTRPGGSPDRGRDEQGAPVCGRDGADRRDPGGRPALRQLFEGMAAVYERLARTDLASCPPSRPRPDRPRER